MTVLNTATAVRLGAAQANRVVLGSTVVWEPGVVYRINQVGGQSNGAARTGAYTTTFDARMKRFQGGLETTDRLDGQSVTNPYPTGWFDSLVAYDELGKDRESLHPGLAAQTPPTVNTIIAATPAIGARHWRELMPGTGSWANMRNGWRRSIELAVAAGATQIDYWLFVDQGEADADNVAPGGSAEGAVITTTEYTTILEQWTIKSTKSLRLAANSVAATLHVLGGQPCIVNGDGWRNMQNGHVAAALGASGYVLAGPRYAFNYDTDGVHLQGIGKRLWGEYLALRQQDVLAGKPLPVCITGGSRVGAVITLPVNTIDGDLVIDTTNVPETTTSYPNSKYGIETFKVSDNSVLAISSVAVSGKNIVITLTADPGGPVRVRYAQQTWPGGNQAVTGSVSKLNRGNIRDSGVRPAVAGGGNLYNWLCHQSVEVA